MLLTRRFKTRMWCGVRCQLDNNKKRFVLRALSREGGHSLITLASLNDDAHIAGYVALCPKMSRSEVPSPLAVVV